MSLTAAIRRMTPNTIVNTRGLTRCITEAPTIEPRTPPMPMMTPIPTSTSPEMPNEAAPAEAMKTMAASEVACA